MIRTWTDAEVYAYRDALLAGALPLGAGDRPTTEDVLAADILTQLAAERQALRDHLSYLLARFEAVRSEDHDAGTVAYSAYLSTQEYRQLRAALPEEEQR